MSSASDLRAVALAEFARAGYAGTSIARIAELAGLSKSAVLYHYASKELLLEASIGPAVDVLESLVTDLRAAPLVGETRDRFLARFIDLLLEHRLAVYLFINQGGSLEDVPVIDRANDAVRAIADFFTSNIPSTEDKMRFGVALGGAAYSLVVAENLSLEPVPDDETRAALYTIMSELLAPVRPALTNAEA